LDTKIMNLVLRAASNLRAEVLWQEETVGLEVPCKEGRSQVVLVAEVEEERYIRFFSPMARFEHLDPCTAFKIQLKTFRLRSYDSRFRSPRWTR